MRPLILFVAALGVFGTTLRAEEFKQVQAVNTERVDFAPGGLIRVNHSYGGITVEGWDRPEVEITVVKSTPFDFHPKHPELASQHVEAVNIIAERKSAGELAISTTLPKRKYFAPPLLRTTTGAVMLDYQIHVPHDSRLVIHHGTGSVMVQSVTGDIEATVGRGDIILWLPPESATPDAYSVDAKVKFGHVTSELDGAAFSRFLIGEGFYRVNSAPAHRLHLRMGFGGITILIAKPESDPSTLVK